jgi:ABC-type Fe3+ transport system permease subunit
VTAIHDALAQAIASSFWIALGAAVIAIVATLFLKELPLRTTHQDVGSDAQTIGQGSATAESDLVRTS